MANLTDADVVDFFDTDLLPTGVVPGEDWRIYIGDPTAQKVFLGTVAQVRQALAPPDLFTTAAPTDTTPGREGQKAYVSHDSVVDLWQYEMGVWAKKLTGLVLNATGPALPKPAKNAFSNFQDTQAGGSVLLVPATGLSPSDYNYRITATGNYQQAPPDGLISVGNVTGEVYAYAVATANRQQSDVAVSGTFTAYAAPTPGTTTPAAPTFTNFNDADNLVQLVPTTGVPMSAYQVRVGTAGAYSTAPADGIISVPATFAGQVFAYSVADTGRNPSLTAASPSFTAPVVQVPTPAAPTFTNFDDAANSVQLVPASGVPLSAYQVKKGAAGVYAPAPVDGIITVDASFAGQVFAYSVASADRNESQAGASPAFTATATAPTFSKFLNPGDNVATLTWDASSQGQVQYNDPVQAVSTVPGANTMAVFYPDLNTQIGQLNYDPADENHLCGLLLNGTLYTNNVASGSPVALSFTNGNVLLG